MISANGKIYNHESAFEEFGYIDWKQKANYEIGDIIYIYCTRPYKRVMFKTKVDRVRMSFDVITDDKKYWIKKDEYEKSKGGDYVRLILLEKVDNEYLSLENLLDNGLNGAPQGPVKVKEELSNYLDSHFNDFDTSELFNDEEEYIYEGHVKSVNVNRYERSSIARQKCIEKLGTNCLICGMNFEKIYGEIGKGFINIHHIVPLNTIGVEYKVNYETDLIPVCPNCHAMLHRKIDGKHLSIDELRSKIKNL